MSEPEHPVIPGPAVLFCPGDRPDRFAKASARADAVIVDLEDAVALDRKAEAREHVREALAWLPAERTLVRINALGTAEADRDLRALRGTGLRHLVVPKVDSPEAIATVSPFAAVALIETARGVVQAARIAATEGCVAMMWGAEDLTADLGGTSSRRSDQSYLPHVEHARTTVLLACRAAGITPWDGTFLDLDDLAALGAETADAVAMGFSAKVVIHPSHVPIVRAAFRPTAERVAWAHDVVAAAGSGGVARVAGRMVDSPLVAQARRVLQAERSATARAPGEKQDTL
jgi:citrate lyase subunit beta/citryl-CoA lyase